MVCALLGVSGYSSIGPLGSVNTIVSAYGLLIVSFMAGVNWGTYLYKAQDISLNLFILSNVIALTAWFAFLYAPFELTVLIFICAFAILLLIDYKLYTSSLISQHYFKTRCIVTGLVVVSLGAFLI